MDGNMFDSLASLGIMNKISTGNSVLDMLLCMLLPIVLRHAPRLLKQAWQHFKRRPDSRPKALVVTRHLDCPHSLDSENDRAAERNHMLREALEVYIGSQPELIARLQVWHNWCATLRTVLYTALKSPHGSCRSPSRALNDPSGCAGS